MVAVGEQHDQTVNTNAQTCSRWQTVLQCGDVVFVRTSLRHHGVLRVNLLQETLGLIFRIVQLGEAVTDFTAADEELKAVGDFRVLVIDAPAVTPLPDTR